MSHFEYMELIGQTNIFEFIESSEARNVGDIVKIKLVDESIDDEAHNYMKYYMSHLLGKNGEIVGVDQKNFSVLIDGIIYLLSSTDFELNKIE